MLCISKYFQSRRAQYNMKLFERVRFFGSSGIASRNAKLFLTTSSQWNQLIDIMNNI
jgi:hypothetical protein